MKNSPIETVVLIHHPNELKTALKKFPQGRKTLYCTLTPHASDQCEKEGISYTPLEDFGFGTDPTELRETIHQNLLRAIALADRITQKHHSTKPYISPYRASFRRLAVLLAGTRSRVHYFSSLISATQAKRIAWFGKPAQVLSEHSGNTFSHEGSVEIALLKFQPWEGIDFIDHFDEKNNFQTQDLSRPNSSQNVLESFQKMDFMHNLKFRVKMLKAGGWNFITSFFSPPKENIVLENHSPFWLETCKRLIQRRHKIHNIKDYTSYIESWQGNNDALENELRKELLASGIFKWEKMDWTDFVFPLIKYLSSLVDPLRQVAREVESLTRKHPIKCLLTIGAHRAHKYAVIQGAKMADAKIITLQHGGFGAYGGIYMSYDDLSISDFHICPGPGDAQLHQHINPDFSKKCKPLGFTNSTYKTLNISNETQNQEIALQKKQQTILYITTHYYLNQGVFLELGSPWNDNLVYKNQKIIITGLKKFTKDEKELKVIIKLHPLEAQYNIPSMGRDFESERFTVIHTKPNAQSLIEVSDVILIDSPATSLVQSVATRKPIFTLNSNLKLFPEAKDMLMRRAVVKEDPHELVKALEEYFLNGFYPADIRNTEFLQSFSDPFGDGKLFERAADLVVEACSKPNLNH